MSVLSDESRAYQQALEATRVEPDASDLRVVLDRARRALVVAWLNELADR